MSVEIYRVLHLTGIFMILLPLGGIGLHMINGGTREFASRKLLAIVHGIGLVIALVAGFGLLARLHGGALPLWAIAKLVIWLWMGAAPVLFYRRAQMAKVLWFAVLILAAVAACLAIFQPF
jgi:hypothetical protein